MEKQPIKIKVFGSGCPTCKKLYGHVKQIAADLGRETEVHYITDFQKITEAGIMSLPAVTVNDKIIMAGLIPGPEKIKKLISDNI
jgi:small redox-active disulfide protein 2